MWKWIRIPKGIALLAFILPWMTVSCSGTKMVSATGFGLAFGQFTSELPNNNTAHDGGPGANIWLILAIVAILVGLFFAFRRNTRESARNLMITSGVALVLILVGTMRYSKSTMLAEAASKNPSANHEMDQAVLAAIRIDWQFGYWLAILALIAAGVMAWLAYSGRESEVSARVRSAMASGAEVPPPAASLTCPTCGAHYGSDTAFCPKDGTALS
jgi:multisubunit Na+/H+ antiporter MnhC subunit